MSIRLTPEQMAAIVEHVEAAYPNEGCGLLVGHYSAHQKTVQEVWPVENARAPEAQSNRYLIPPDEMFKGERLAEQKGMDIVGIFHSHPDHPERPSEFDREHAWPGYTYLITSVREGHAEATAAWTLSNDRERFNPEDLAVTSNDQVGSIGQDQLGP